MTAKARYAFEKAPLSDLPRYNIRVQRMFRPVLPDPFTDLSKLTDQECLRLCLRSFFGSFCGKRVVAALGVSKMALSNWVTGKRRIPYWVPQRLFDLRSEIVRRRKAEIRTREREFAAIIEQERILLERTAPHLLDDFVADDPLSRPDSILVSGRMRYHRRRQEAAARPIPLPSALLQLFLADPDAALAATLAAEMHQSSQELATKSPRLAP